MAIQNRETTLPGIWAENAQTEIPTPPIAGVTYRDTTLNSTAIDKAWPFKTIVDSSDFNQHAFLQDTLIKESEQYGIMRWNNTTTYKEAGFCLGQDGKLYQALRDNQGKEPTASPDDWKVFTSGGGFPIGSIGYTLRTKVPEGSKWCDGTQYAATDPDCARVYQMLVDGELESVSFTVFDQTVTDSGSCGFFGLDTATQSFKVPKLNNVYLKAGNTPLIFGAQSLPNIKGELYSINLTGQIESDGCLYQTELNDAGIRNDNGPLKGSKLHVDASKSSAIYQDNADVNPEHVTYRAYVVIYASELDIDVAEAEAARDAAIAAKNEAAASATAASGSATQAAGLAAAAAQSAEEAKNQVLPDQTGQDGKYLTTNNGTPAWAALDLSGKANIDLDNITATGKANILALQKLDWDNRVQILTNDGSTSIEQGYTPPCSGVLQHFTRAAGSRAMGIYKGNTISNDKVLYYFRSDDSNVSFYYGLLEVEGGEPYWLQGNPNSEEICFIPYLGA